jgi:hypothetical protein
MGGSQMQLTKDVSFAAILRRFADNSFIVGHRCQANPSAAMHSNSKICFGSAESASGIEKCRDRLDLRRRYV